MLVLSLLIGVSVGAIGIFHRVGVVWLGVSGTGARQTGPMPQNAPTGDGSTPQWDEIPDAAAAVLDLVDRIPPGRVMTYGDIADYLSGATHDGSSDGSSGRIGPRQVGSVMAHWGGAVAWWRVIRADGSPPPGHETRALQHYHREGTPLRSTGTRVDLAEARWDGGVEPSR